MEYPDAQLEYIDSEGRTGRVNVEIATEHYSAKSIGAKAAAGFAVHGSNGRATARVARSLGQDQGSGGGGGGGRDKGFYRTLKKEDPNANRGRSVLD